MIDQETYKKIAPEIDKAIANGGVDCAKLAAQFKTSYSTVIRYYSYHLKFVTDERLEYIRLKEITCPTCGKLKDQVTDPAICRDMIHFV